MGLFGKALVFSCLLLVPLSAFASGTPETAQALYVDPDPAAYAINPAAEKRDLFLVEVDQQIAKEPDNAYFIAVRAYQYCLDGEVSTCDEYYARALNSKSVSPEDMRYVLWSKGWSMFILKRYRQAIADWKEAEHLHGGKPFWIAYTLSIAYWCAEDKEQALNYFELAVKSNKAWGDDDMRAELTSHWKPAEKKAMKEVARYWKIHGKQRK
ncbi:MAG: tetratricopeptide repeat protein [Arenimonas sp.]